MRIGHQLGLVISERNLRVCLIRRWLFRNHILEVETFALDADYADSWLARIKAVADIVAGYLEKHRLKNIPINMGLLGEDIAFRRMYLPHMPPKELTAAIMWEGEKLFPFDFSQCSIDYEIVDCEKRNDIDHVGINIVAAKANIMEIIYEQFHAAKLKVGQIGFLPAYIASVLSASELIRADEHSLILYLDDEYSTAMFAKDSNLIFFQQFVTKPLESPEGDRGLANISALAAELTSFFDLYNGQGIDYTVSGIVVCGKYAQNPDTIEFLRDRTGIACRPIFDDESLPGQLGYPTKGQMESHLDALTAALVSPDYHPLAPVTIRRAEEKKKMITRVGIVTALAMFAAFTMQFQLHMQEQSRRSRLESAKAAVHSFEESSGYQGYINLMGKLDRGQAYLSKTEDVHRSHFHILMKELSLLAPEYINLTGIDCEEDEGKYVLRLNGHVRLTGFSPEIVLAEYVEALGASAFFDNVTVSHHDKNREQDRFDLAFQLKMDARV
jgi:hypothetical protein